MSSASANSTQMSTDFIKPAVGAAVAVAADKFILNNTNMNQSLIFGAAVGGALYAASVITPTMPVLIPTATLSNGKTIEDRVLEITAGSVGAYTINRFVFKNDFNRNDMMKKIAIVALADFVGEYASDYANNRALSYFV
jgi:hypothetical protein